ncbi:MAG: riboflavin biosynthesis protein RibD [Candidatus Omnitrophica bacterium CG11_big_fil_rev_8_21_14_0_20_45_26]|uniref:Riboflavin biosynthesis protein RibD n=1 Tax=Candidatus Abzuiibacterium crystallinum TaxID=1974748 RepID=A0A2H0LMH3_9BACT|nr:MAG: riboflavin biosynthesis protein RibD [Candidatus Omnitrophica bacterium CG11_big_fil_rev_8_21_14_0_20_45_26]PIW65140.1 MAG: riboflavin biosynthesis protein RibD [Candidatus Omnitrophica bacterium CG12_big_fil_rev_8_21_14_0_65_45_16]
MPALSNPHHARFMARALQLAARGRGRVSPNPLVGACVVRNGHIIAEGYHANFGGPHAEIVALKRLGKRAKGATLYVTLEPCSTWGKTPPCTDFIRQNGIKHVVIGCQDPNPLHAGRGIRLLRQKGIRVTANILREEAVKLNEAFAKWIKTQMPFVILKMAESLDGKIATETGDSKWVSGKAAREWAHSLRASVDGILVGKNTILKDNPRLTARHGRFKRTNPWRLVLDTKAQLSNRHRIFHQSGTTVLVCGESYLNRAVQKHRRSHISVMPVKLKDQKIDLRELVIKLGRLGVTSLLVEGGGETAASFLKSHLVDKIYFVIAPKIIGGKHAPTAVEGDGIRLLKEAKTILRVQVRLLDRDLLVEGYC